MKTMTLSNIVIGIVYKDLFLVFLRKVN